MYLVAIIPSNYAEQALLDLKKKLFQQCSLLSAWALKPMIPLALLEENPLPVERKSLPILPESGLDISVVEKNNNHYILSSVNCREFCKDVAAALGVEQIEEGLAGLQLFDDRESGAKEAVGVINNIVKELSPTVKLWKTCSVSVFKTDEGLFSSNGWWNRVVLESLTEIKFPKVSRR